MITKSGIDSKNFKSGGTADFKLGLENTYTCNVPTDLYVLTNDNGMEVAITNFGARVVSIFVSGIDGEFRDVVLGYDNIEQYMDTSKPNFFGTVCGRYANRISNPNKLVSDEKYRKVQNDGEAILHGGEQGWHYQTFSVVSYEPENGKLALELVSPDGDAGFRGEVCFQLTYTLTQDNTLRVEYKATTTDDTVLNVTNHSFFNLSGDCTLPAIDHFLYLNSEFITPIRTGVLPTGEIAKIAPDSAFDFYQNEGKFIERDIAQDNEQIKLGDGYDNNFILKHDVGPDAVLVSPHSGLAMIICTQEPAIQLYSAVHLDGSLIGKGGVPYKSYAGVALETQHYPDSPNYSHFPTTELHPGEVFKSSSEYKFDIVEGIDCADEASKLDVIKSWVAKQKSKSNTHFSMLDITRIC